MWMTWVKALESAHVDKHGALNRHSRINAPRAIEECAISNKIPSIQSCKIRKLHKVLRAARQLEKQEDQNCCNKQWRRMRIMARTHSILQEIMSNHPNTLAPPEIWTKIIQKQEVEDRNERLAAHKDKLQNIDSAMRNFIKERKRPKIAKTNGQSTGRS